MMRSDLYGIYGVGGYGRQVMPVARKWLLAHNPTGELLFIDDHTDHEYVNGHAVVSFKEFTQHEAAKKHIAIAIANSKVRAQIADQLKQHQIKPWTIKDSSVIIMDDVQIGEGSILTSIVQISADIRMGMYFQANHYSHVAHDCVIGDFVTFAPGVRCNGNVVIEDHAYIGTGAMLRQGTPDKPLVIGKTAVVGMGAVVTKDVPPNTTVVGNPARPLVKT